MRKLILILLFFFCVNANAQEQNIADLDALYQSIKMLPSYKDQLKNDKSYYQLYETLRKGLNTKDELIVFQKLVQLILPLRDNHLSLRAKLDSNTKFIPFKPIADLQKLTEKFANYPLDSIEGIYYKENLRYLVYKNEENVYYIQNLATSELKAILFQNRFGSYDAIQLGFGGYSYILNRNIKLLNGFLVGLNYMKDEKKIYYNFPTKKENFEYKVLDNQIGYLSLGSFDARDEAIKEATDFFNKVKSEIKVKKLIVDVRNNGGGGDKTSDQFISFLTKFKGDVYILQCTYTASNAEQFILKLKEKRKVVTLGESTRGMPTYGNNYGNRINLPSNRFSFNPTDMRGLKKWLMFETIGIKPDIYLNPFTEDWITQTLKKIK